MPADDGTYGDQKSRRSGSFGAVASTYQRFRASPPPAAIGWMLPESARTVVDLGAGTGAMTKDLLAKVDHVIAIEPDDRMRDILAGDLPEVTALRGSGESMPLDTSSVDAVLASSCWHWMDPDGALQETARVLVPGGILGVVWAGPDPEGPFVTQAQAMLSEMSSGQTQSDLSGSGGNGHREPGRDSAADPQQLPLRSAGAHDIDLGCASHGRRTHWNARHLQLDHHDA